MLEKYPIHMYGFCHTGIKFLAFATSVCGMQSTLIVGSKQLGGGCHNTGASWCHTHGRI